MGPCARPGVCIQCVAGLCLCRVSHIGARHVVSARCVHRYVWYRACSGKPDGLAGLSGFGTGCSDSLPRCVLSSVGSSTCRARASHCRARAVYSSPCRWNRLQSACEGLSAAVDSRFLWSAITARMRRSTVRCGVSDAPSSGGTTAPPSAAYESRRKDLARPHLEVRRPEPAVWRVLLVQHAGTTV